MKTHKLNRFSKYKLPLTIAGIVAAFLLGMAVNQAIVLRKAHSSFDDYYAFRGCVQLLQKTSDYGICKTSSGQTIKIVEFRGKWYLNNDLPRCPFNICF